MDPAGFNQEDLDAVRGLDFITDTCELNRLPIEIADQQVFGLEEISSKNAMGIGFDPEVFFALNAIDWTAGSLDTALPSLKDGSGVLVADRFQTAKGYDVGDPITLKVGRAEQEFTIVGIVSSAGWIWPPNCLASAISTRSMPFRRSSLIDVVAEVFETTKCICCKPTCRTGLMTPKQNSVSPKPPPGWCSRSGRWILGTIDGIGRTSMAIMTSVAFGAWSWRRWPPEVWSPPTSADGLLSTA